MRNAYTPQPKAKVKQGNASRTLMGEVSQLAEAVLRSLLHPRNMTSAASAVTLLSHLTPGLSGCVSSRSTADFSRSSSPVKDATVRVLVALHADMHASIVTMLHDALMAAPDRAALRNMLADAANAVVQALSAAQRDEWLAFLALMTLSPNAVNRLMGLQCAEALVKDFLCLSAPTDGPQAACLPCPPSHVLLAILAQRCADKHSSVRAKALSCLAKSLGVLLDALDDSDPSHRAELKQFLQVLCASDCLKLDRNALRKAGPVDDDSAGASAAASTSAAAEAANGDHPPGTPATPSDQAGPSSRPCDTPPITSSSPSPAPSMSAAPQFPCFFVWAFDASNSVSPQILLQLIFDKAGDSKAAVRRSCAHLVASLLVLIATALEAPQSTAGPSTSTNEASPVKDAMHEGLKLFLVLANDASVMVRRAVIDAVSMLLEHLPDSADAARAWARIVFPMLQDPEASAQEAVRGEVLSKLIEPITKIKAKAPSGGSAATFGPDQLRRLRGVRCVMRAVCNEIVALQACLRAVCQGLKASISAGPLCSSLQLILAGVQGAAPITRSERTFMWALITEVIASCSGGASVSFMLDAWADLEQQLRAQAAARTVSRDAGLHQEAAAVLCAIAASVALLTPEQSAAIMRDAYGVARACLFDAALVSCLVNVLALLSLKLGLSGPPCLEGGPWQAGLYDECHAAVLGCLEHLHDALEPSPDLSDEIERASIALFTAGQIALESGHPPPASLLLMVQALTSPSKLQQHSALLSPRLATPRPSDAQLAIPPCMQAHAWAALGKFSLVSEALSRETTPLLVAELARNPLPAVRNNVLISLCDMCMQYTLLVDSHLWKIARAMTDRHPLVRKQALALLAGLLQREFVKWRGPLFLQFLLALVDDSPTVRQMAALLVTDVLAKTPTLAHNHFLEIVFMLNDSTDAWKAARRRGGLGSTQDGFSQSSLMAAGGDLRFGAGGFSQSQGTQAQQTSVPRALSHLAGPSPRAHARRLVIYRALLRAMPPQYKFAVIDRLTEEVIATAADAILPLDACHDVICDVLHLIASPLLRIEAPSKAGAGAEDEEPLEEGASQIAQIQGRLATATAAVAKAVLERVVPALAALKGMLEERRHALQQQVRDCMVGLLAEHGEEMEAVLASHRQLVAELRFQLQEKTKQKPSGKTKSKGLSRAPQAAAEVRTPLAAVSPRLPLVTPAFLGAGALPCLPPMTPVAALFTPNHAQDPAAAAAAAALSAPTPVQGAALAGTPTMPVQAQAPSAAATAAATGDAHEHQQAADVPLSGRRADGTPTHAQCVTPVFGPLRSTGAANTRKPAVTTYTPDLTPPPTGEARIGTPKLKPGCEVGTAPHPALSLQQQSMDRRTSQVEGLLKDEKDVMTIDTRADDEERSEEDGARPSRLPLSPVSRQSNRQVTREQASTRHGPVQSKMPREPSDTADAGTVDKQKHQKRSKTRGKRALPDS